MEINLWRHIARVRNESPLVYNITNYVVMNNTANALLAVGASPIMSHAHSEIQEMARISQSLVVNIGTLDEYWLKSMLQASLTFQNLQKPWVLDPVGAGATTFRNTSLVSLLSHQPTVIRGNASEIMALAQVDIGSSKGVDSTASSSHALAAAHKLSVQTNAIVCVSGEVDYIVQQQRILEIHNGHPLMTKVTGLGCSATALIGAFIANTENHFEATTAALALLSIAGELAQYKSQGPGTLQLHLLDILHSLDEATFLKTSKIKSV